MVETISHSAQLGTGAVVAAFLIFLGSYAVIISERVHRTIVAIFGAALMVLFGIFLDFYDQAEAINFIDFNTIGLLLGMMIIVGISKDTGLFQYVAVRAAKIARGNPWLILVMFSLITAVFSAFLNNVTNVLLIVPMTLVICDHLGITPMPFLFAEILMSNVGGTATLIGDPPNILIGSAAGLSFMDFIINIAPVIVMIFMATLWYLKWKYKKDLRTDWERMESVMNLNERDGIKDVVLLKKTLFVLGLVIVGFFIHGFLHIEAATVALFGAGLLLWLDNKDPEKVLQEIEWTTIFFFVGLFILVGGLESVGIIAWATTKLLVATQGSLVATSMIMLWGGSFFSAFIDNIPFVATMIPMIQDMAGVFGEEGLDPIWWSLVLGACLGGNGTLVGASSNLVVAGMAEKSGYKIGFWEFMKVGMTATFISMVISTVYVFIMFL